MKLTQVAAALVVGALVAQDATQEESKIPEVGDTAPTFRLNDQQGKVVEVGGKKEHWTVLAFFPKAMTPG